jgi:hypothetical protein
MEQSLTARDYSYSAADAPELAPYRAISRSAVISISLAIVSVPLVALALFSAVFKYGDAVPLGFVGSIFAVAAVILGLIGRSTIRRYPTEYTGARLAATGLLGGALLFITGASVSAYTYSTEVPEGFLRVTFGELQPDPDRPELPVSPKALELSGKKVFIKGYMHPGVASMGKVNHFIMVNDFGTCCFGGQPKPTHMVEIHIPDGVDGVAYSTHKIKLAGTFALSEVPTQSLGLQGVWYHLLVDQVR